MRSYSPPVIERARPLLGTIVAVRVQGVTARRAQRGIEQAFCAVAEIHRLMSFQQAASDVSRLNREAALRAVTIDSHTYRVLAWAQRIARASNGMFDASIGARLVDWGILHAPAAAAAADRNANFRDIALLPGRRVRFKRPLWIDLSGIAKGYAVDRAISALMRCGIAQACVNAGGDLRTLGEQAERVALRTAVRSAGALPMIEIRGAALATSSGAPTHRRHHAHDGVSAHVAGHTRQGVDPWMTVSVLAKRCVIADALTKVVLADPHRGAATLKCFGAAAYVHHPHYPGSGWQSLGALQ